MQTTITESENMNHFAMKYAPGANPYADLNSEQTTALMRSIEAGTRSGVALTELDGKIYHGFPVSVGEKTVLPKENLLVKNAAVYKNWRRAMIAGAAGEAEKYKPEDAFTELYLGIRERGARVHKLAAENPYVPVHSLMNYAEIRGAAGPIATDYETIRRVNYMLDITGPQFVLEKYNAIQAVQVKPTENLNVQGFRRTAKLGGYKELGDKTRPGFAPNAYDSYTKWLQADAFRYETSLRERSDSIFGLEAQFTQDIPGIFAELKDGKITDGMNAASSSTPSSDGDWDALLSTYETHYTSHAENTVAAAIAALLDYGTTGYVIWNRDLANAYLRNVNGTPIINSQSTGVPTTSSNNSPYSWMLPRNPGVTGLINESITSGAMVAVTDQWGMLLQGPKIQVTYQDQMTPGQLEGRIIFDYNGFKERTPSAGLKYLNLLS